jgi:hypothetical protein
MFIAKKMRTKEKIKEMLIAGEIDMTSVIAATIEINGIIGVGLITFADDVSNFIRGYKKS